MAADTKNASLQAMLVRAQQLLHENHLDDADAIFARVVERIVTRGRHGPVRPSVWSWGRVDRSATPAFRMAQPWPFASPSRRAMTDIKPCRRDRPGYAD